MIDLSKYGITGATEIVHNPSYEALFEAEMDPTLEGYEKGQLTELGAVNVMTGIYTGRSPKDKYIVMDANSKNTVWWTLLTLSAAPTPTPGWPSASSWRWHGRHTS